MAPAENNVSRKKTDGKERGPGNGMGSGTENGIKNGADSETENGMENRTDRKLNVERNEKQANGKKKGVERDGTGVDGTGRDEAIGNDKKETKQFKKKNETNHDHNKTQQIVHEPHEKKTKLNPTKLNQNRP